MSDEKQQANLNFRIDKGEYDKLIKIAADTGTSLSSLMRILVKNRLREVEKKGWEPEKFLK